MKKNTKIFIVAAIAAVLLIGLMLLLIFLPKGDGDGSATYDEGVKMSVSTDANGVHQATIITDKNGNIENNSYGTLVEYDTNKISTIHIENAKGTLDITSTIPKND